MYFSFNVEQFCFFLYLILYDLALDINVEHYLSLEINVERLYLQTIFRHFWTSRTLFPYLILIFFFFSRYFLAMRRKNPPLQTTTTISNDNATSSGKWLIWVMNGRREMVGSSTTTSSTETPRGRPYPVRNRHPARPSREGSRWSRRRTWILPTVSHESRRRAFLIFFFFCYAWCNVRNL